MGPFGIKKATNMNSFLCLCLIVLATTANAGKNRPSGSGSSSAATTTTTEAATDGTSGTSGSDGIYGATIAALTSRDSVETSSNCGDGATGYYEEYVDGDTRYVIISGAPSHDAEYDQEHANPNTRCERWQYAALPLTWSDSGSNTQSMGATGFVTSGGVVYDHRSSPTGDLASYYEWDSLDPYFGHSDADAAYHYHAIPALYSSAADSSACEHLGYMLDGAKIIGYCEIDGVQVTSCFVQNTSSDPTHEDDYTYTNDDGCILDECNMGTLDGETVYFITPNYPYVPPCMKGSVASAYGFTPDIRA